MARPRATCGTRPGAAEPSRTGGHSPLVPRSGSVDGAARGFGRRVAGWPALGLRRPGGSLQATVGLLPAKTVQQKRKQCWCALLRGWLSSSSVALSLSLHARYSPPHCRPAGPFSSLSGNHWNQIQVLIIIPLPTDSPLVSEPALPLARSAFPRPPRHNVYKTLKMPEHWSIYKYYINLMKYLFYISEYKEMLIQLLICLLKP